LNEKYIIQIIQKIITDFIIRLVSILKKTSFKVSKVGIENSFLSLGTMYIRYIKNVTTIHPGHNAAKNIKGLYFLSDIFLSFIN
jgi:hypothetical protein